MGKLMHSLIRRLVSDSFPSLTPLSHFPKVIVLSQLSNPPFHTI